MEKQLRTTGVKVDKIDLPDLPELPGLPPAQQHLLDAWWQQVRETMNRYARDVAG